MEGAGGGADGGGTRRAGGGVEARAVHRAHAADNRPGERRLRAHGQAELVVGGGGELPRRVLVQRRAGGRQADTGEGLVDRDADTAGRGKTFRIGDGHQEVVGPGLGEGGGGIPGRVGGVVAEGDRCGRRTSQRPRVGEVAFPAVVGPQDTQGGGGAGNGVGRSAGGRGHRRGRVVHSDDG